MPLRENIGRPERGSVALLVEYHSRRQAPFDGTVREPFCWQSVLGARPSHLIVEGTSGAG